MKKNSPKFFPGITSFLKWLLVGICLAGLFVNMQPVLRMVIGFIIVVWAFFSPLMASWVLLDLSSWAFAEGNYLRAAKLSRMGCAIDTFITPLANLFGMSQSPFKSLTCSI